MASCSDMAVKNIVEEGFSSVTAIVALISGGLALVGVIASDSKSHAVIGQRVDEFTRRIEEHNCLVE